MFIGFLEFIVGLVILAFIILWVYRDAVDRYPKGSFKPMLWVIVVLFMHLMGLILYVLLRPEKVRSGE